MEIILQENVPGLGFVGDLVRVKSGYARNYLFPKKFALPATKHYQELFAHQKKVLEIKKSQREKEAKELQGRLEGISLQITHTATESGKLFGSVSVAELHEVLIQQGFDIDRKLIRIPAPIRSVGKHSLEVKLHQEVTATLSVEITAKAVEKKTPESEMVTEKETKKKEKKKTKKQTEEIVTELKLE